VNTPRQNNVTPLHLAATSGDIRIVKKLVEHKARINVLDSNQATPLHRATAYNHEEVIEYLVKKYVYAFVTLSSSHVRSNRWVLKSKQVAKFKSSQIMI